MLSDIIWGQYCIWAIRLDRLPGSKSFVVHASEKDVKLKIVTSHDDNYKDIGSITTKSMHKYADKFNLKFEFLNMPDKVYVSSSMRLWRL